MAQLRTGPGECPLCGGESRDRALCSVCTRQVREDLRHLPGLMRDLSITRTRRSAIRSSGGGIVVLDPDESMPPFDDRATRRAQEIAATVGEWLQHFEVDGDLYVRTLLPCDCTVPLAPCQRIVRLDFAPGRTITGWCAWLTDRLDRIRLHPDGPRFAEAVGKCVTAARRTVDLPPDVLFVRECPVCLHGIFAPVDADVAVCRRCRKAGVDPLTEWPVSEAREVMQAGVDDQLATAGTCALVLAAEKIPVKVDTIQNWARPERGGRLIARGTDRHGRAVYRVGDVRELAQAAAARASSRDRKVVAP